MDTEAVHVENSPPPPIFREVSATGHATSNGLVHVVYLLYKVMESEL